MTALDEAVPASASAVGPEFFRPDMPLDQLRPSPLNPRKHFDPGSLEELAQSIRALGVIEPLVARQVGDHYEIVAGDRRWRAAQLALLTTLPVMVKPLTDAQALEIMVVENNQREDVSALEEADGFSRLLKGGYELERLVGRLGRSKKYVYDRLKLLQLIPPAQQLLTDGRITAGHAILLARLAAKDQARAVEPTDGRGGGIFQFSALLDAEPTKDDPFAGLSVISVRELDGWIEDNVRLDLSKPIAVEDFPDVARAQEVAAQVVSITREYRVDQEAGKDGAAGDRILSPNKWKRADGTKGFDPAVSRQVTFATCAASLLGVVVIGQGRGATFAVCVDKACDVHWKAERASPAAKPGVDRRAGIDQRARESREAAAAAAKRKTWATLGPLVVADAIDQVKGATAITAAQAAVIGHVDVYNVQVRLERALGKTWFKTPVAAWLALAVTDFHAGESFEAFVKGVAKPLGLNVTRLEAVRDKSVQTSAPKAAATRKIAPQPKPKAAKKKKR